jgi:ribose 5-phosphate isomerase B
MKPFDLVTEADARTLPLGATIELRAGGRITPLAQDTLRARRVTVISAGAADTSMADGLVPVADIRRLAVGADHTGVTLKREIVSRLRGRGLAVSDEGTGSAEPVDYPDIAARVARVVARGEADAGIVIDGAGIGSAIAANKIRGIRAVMCADETIARYAREHNGANVLTLGATLLPAIDAAMGVVEVFLGTPMREPRYIRRLAKIRRLEERFGSDHD